MLRKFRNVFCELFRLPIKELEEDQVEAVMEVIQGALMKEM